MLHPIIVIYGMTPATTLRKLFVTCWLLLILTGIAYLFWYNEWKYTLPTPVPLHLHTVDRGDHVDISSKIKTEKGKPVFIHFFNPDCPCSRFNLPHFNSLVKKYGDKFTFAVVIINKNKNYNERDIRDKFDLRVPILSDQSIADSCGVYSTPQAVILDDAHDLYYRGNYNRSRYCTDMKSNFAQMAIDSLLHHDLHPAFNQYALKAYGCQLPYCTR
jgi:thiol-disulfide isomerase/thioredoxin